MFYIISARAHWIVFDAFNCEGFSYRYYECSFRRDVQCKVRLTYKNGKYILNRKHEGHEKPVNLIELKKEIEASQSYETSRMIKKNNSFKVSRK